MTIEFQCARCGKWLHTRDESAGKQVKCPDCGEILRVAEASPGDFVATSGPSAGATSDEGRAAENPYRAPAIQPRPEPSPQFPDALAVPPEIDIGDIWSRVWTILKNNLPICIAAAVLPFVIQFGLGFVLGLLQPVIHRLADRDVATIFSVGLQFGLNLLSAYFGVGQRTLMLNLALGRDANIIDLFPSPLVALKVFAGWLLVLVAVVITAITIVGPFIVALMFWPYSYIMIEHNRGIWESMASANAITRGSRLSVLGLAIVTWIVTMAATIGTCCLGGIVAIPFFMLVFAVTYVVLTGRPTADKLS